LGDRGSSSATSEISSSLSSLSMTAEARALVGGRPPMEENWVPPKGACGTEDMGRVGERREGAEVPAEGLERNEFEGWAAPWSPPGRGI
jgi:hypothetical protein